MEIYLIDGTYELFRCYFGAPSRKNAKKKEIGAARALARSLAAWLRSGAVTHIACAFDHVIESFRNRMFDGYKTSEGVDPALLSQFELAERVTRTLGVVTWPMVEFEADDALATAAHRFAKEKKISQIRIASPDKDLAQCVRGDRIVLWDRKNSSPMNELAVVKKFGVTPNLIPDLLALVGDTADGIPGIPRWGMKSTAIVLSAHGQIENIPKHARDWKEKVRGADALCENLNQEREAALLYRKLATLRLDVPLKEHLSDLEWKGVDRKALAEVAEEIDDPGLLERFNEGK